MLKSTWKDAKKGQQYQALKKDISTEVLIVGGGMAGIMTAYSLAKAGISVVVVEKNTIGSDATGQTTAFLTEDIDTDLSDLKSMFGARKARMISRSHEAAIDVIEKISKNEKIDCEFKRVPIYIYANNEKEFANLEKDFKTAQELGLTTILQGKNNKSPLPFPHAGYLKIPDQAKFHPLKFLNGLTAKAVKAGVEIYERTEVIKVRYNKTGAIAETARNKIKAKEVLIATYQPLGNPWATFLKKGMYVSYVLEIEVPKKMFPEGLYLDTENPYHYFRIDVRNGSDRMILGGEDHRDNIKIAPRKNYQALRKYLTRLMMGRPYKINRYWVGPILEPSDGLALIGRTKPHELVATAFSGNGMTYSVITAQLITDILKKNPNPLRKLYDPKRIPTAKQLAKKALDYSEELYQGAIKNALSRK